MRLSESAAAHPRFRPDIQGIRGIAVLAVVAAHLGIPGLAGGFVGVDVFYVISGFLIAGLLHREVRTTGRFSIVGFYGRRARRILPAAFMVLGVVVVASRLLLNPLRAASVADDATWSALFAFNVRLIRQGADYFSQGTAVSPLQHYWSLAVEEQFYLVFPFVLVAVVVLAGRRRVAHGLLATVAILALASFVWSVHHTPSAPVSAYFSSLTRAWQLGLGAVVGIWADAFPVTGRRRLGTALACLGLGSLAVSIAFVDGTAYPGAIALWPTVSAALILAAGSLHPTGPAQRCLSWRPLGWVGLVSFSLYLWHWPVIVFGRLLLPSMDIAWRTPLLLATSLALAALSYWLVERPFMKRRGTTAPPRARWKHSLDVRPGFVAGVALLLLLAILAPTLSASQAGGRHAESDRIHAKCDTPELASPEARWTCRLRLAIQADRLPAGLDPPLKTVLHDREESGCLNVTPAGVASCRWGNGPARRTIELLGDSHAEMWLTPLRAVFPADRFVIQSLTMGRCPNAVITRNEPSFPTLGRECDAHRRWVWSYVARTHPFAVVMSDSEGFTSWRAPDGTAMEGNTVQRWGPGLATSLARLRPYTRHIVLIGQTPRSQRITECLPRDLKLDACYGDNFMAMQRAVERRAVAHVGGLFVDPSPWLCIGRVCPPVIDDTAAYWDNSHLTKTMARKLTPLLRDSLVGVLADAAGRPVTRAAKAAGLPTDS